MQVNTIVTISKAAEDAKIALKRAEEKAGELANQLGGTYQVMKVRIKFSSDIISVHSGEFLWEVEVDFLIEAIL